MSGMTTVLDETNVPGTRTLYRLAVILAAISGAFCLLFCILLAVHYHGLLSPGGRTTPAGMEPPPSSEPSYRLPAGDAYNQLPTDYHSFLALRNALAQDRQNDELRTQIRELDHELRTGYFQRRITVHRLAHMLIISSILFFVAMRTITTLKRQFPDPGNFKTNKANPKNGQKELWHVAVPISWLMLFTGLYAGLLLAPSPQLEQIFAEKLASESAADNERGGVSLPVIEAIKLTEEILAKHWVSFRNFDGNGVGFSDNPPIQWDGTTGKNIVWKKEVPLPGNSSPVIWTDDTGSGKLFLAGADEELQKIFCYDIKDGTLLWTADVTRPEAKMPEVDHYTSYAAPTPVVDGQHVYAMFANGELVAVDFNGKFVWRHSFGTPDNHYGFASSPALYFDRLIVQFDDGDGTEGNSKIIAFDLNTGDILWETIREEVTSSWASPTIKKIGDSYQIITCANPFVIAYNPEDGKELWRCKCLAADVGPSAAALGNVVLITNDSPRTTAIDATGSGDVTATHILWTGAGSTPEAASPLITDDYFLTISTGGWLSGYDPKVIDPNRKRARYWELEIGDGASFYSSPLRVGTYVYFFDMTEVNEARGKQPKAFVVDLSKVAVNDDGTLTEESAAAMVIAENSMSEPCVTCPVILNNRLYIRGEKTLYCIGEN